MKVHNNNIAAETARRQKVVGIVTSSVCPHGKLLVSPSRYSPLHLSICRVSCHEWCYLQENVPILGGPRGVPMTEFCNRDVALVTPERGELRFIVVLFFKGDLATLLDRVRFRRGVIRASADLPDRTGRETEARAAGSEGRDATSR
jgi:hypothetical protein